MSDIFDLMAPGFNVKMKTRNLNENKRYFNAWIPIILMSICCSCASYKTQYAPEANKWETDKPAPNLIVKHTMYLVGDAGNSSEPKIVPVLKYLKDTLSKESANSSILFLGDNIYPKGLPPEVSKKRKVAEYRLHTQTDALKKFKGYPVFTPGNHDWAHGINGITLHLLMDHMAGILLSGNILYRRNCCFPVFFGGYSDRLFHVLPQDKENKKYQRLTKTLLAGVNANRNVIFVSGHEHKLQYLESGNHKFIVSGSGSKTSAVGMGKESLFSSSSVGFSTLSFFENGETWVTFYQVAEDGNRAIVIFQKKINNS